MFGLIRSLVFILGEHHVTRFLTILSSFSEHLPTLTMDTEERTPLGVVADREGQLSWL